jgi:hypothetical protein
VVVRPGVVEVDGRPFAVGATTRVEAIIDPPRFKVWLGALILGLLGVPAAVVYGSLSQARDATWVVAVPVALAATAMVRILTASTRYHVALLAGRRSRYVYSSEDLQTVVFLVAMVRDAIPVRR